MTTVTVPLSEAKARFSSLIRRVETDGARFIISKNNKPIAKIVPLSGADVKSIAGSLSQYAHSDLIAEEGSAFARAMEAKHATNR